MAGIDVDVGVDAGGGGAVDVGGGLAAPLAAS